MFRWLKPRRPHPAFPPDTPLQAVRYLVLDTEFTSLDKRSNRLLSIGAIVMQGPKIQLGDQFYRVLNPGVDVPAPGVLVHKLRPHDLQNGDAPAAVLQDLQPLLAGSVLVGHFVNMDLKILRKELRGTGHALDNPAVDTAHIHRWLLRRGRYSEDLFHHLENLDLATLAKHYNIDFHEAHHALDDAFVTARLWQKLLHELETQGVYRLGELLRI